MRSLKTFALAAAFVAVVGSPAPPMADDAHAARENDPETGEPTPCLKPTGDEKPELRLVGPALIDVPYKAELGQPVEVRVTRAAIFVPSQRCADEGREVPLRSRSWSLPLRPTGSTASVARVGKTGFNVRLTPDVAGRYTVRFTACPSGCTVDGTKIARLTREVSFTAIQAAETRITNDQWDNLVSNALDGTRLQISHTDAGTPVYGTPYTVRWKIPPAKYEQLTNCDGLQGQALRNCQARAERIEQSGQTRVRTITPKYQSYVEFGRFARDNGAPAHLPFSAPQIEEEVPRVLRAIFVLLQPAGLVASTDLDRIRLSINNLNQTFALATLRSAIADGKLRLATSLNTGSPAIKCEGHFKRRVGYVLNVDEGWSDALCPDFGLEPIKVDMSLNQRIDSRGQLFVGRPDIALGLKPKGTAASLAEFLADVTGQADDAFAPLFRRAWDGGGCKSAAKALGTVLRRYLQSRLPPVEDLGPILHARVVGPDLVISYEPIPGGSIEPCSR